jgi:hypothetical protein
VERSEDRRWDIVVPLATFAVAAAILAVTAGTGASAPSPTPLAGTLAALARAVEPTGALARGLAIALVAGAATAVGATVAGARPGWPGRLAGVVAAGWLIATPPVRALAGAPTAGTVALVALAALALAIDRIARGGGAVAGRYLGLAAIAAVAVEARAWPAFAIGAALVLYRARLGARWAPEVAIAAAVTAVVALVPAAIAGGPAWPAWPSGPTELAQLVDELGPLTLAIAVAGLASALTARGDRWLAATLAACMVAGVPPAPPLGAGLVIGLAIAAGLAVAALLARAPALRHQLVTAASVLALVAGSIAWA